MADGTCSVDDCERPRRGPRTEWCNTHYFRVRRNGHPGPAEIWDRKPRHTQCSIDGCTRDPFCRGMCTRHYHRWRRWGNPLHEWTHPTGSDNHKWMGENIGYGTAHERVRAARGQASEHPCSQGCGRQAQHWAYDHDDPRAHTADEGAYSTDPNHYQPMCVSCHKLFDLSRA